MMEQEVIPLKGSVGMIISRKEFFETGDQNFKVITNGIDTYDEPAMDIFCFYLNILELKVNLSKKQISMSMSNSEVWHECGKHHLIPSPPHPTLREARPREIGSRLRAAVWLTKSESHPHPRCGLPIVMTACLVPCLCLCPKD